MFTKRIFFIIALLFCFSSAHSQQDESGFPIRVSNILIFGNEKTKDEVILREIPFELPAEMDLEDLQFIQNRLTNLFLFNRVELGIIGEPGNYILTIQVAEIFYIYPVPLLFINERDWSKISYGFQVTHANFRGMHEKVSLGGWLGYNPAFFLRYSNPWLGKKSRLILGFSAGGRRVQNKAASADSSFDESHLGGSINLGRRMTLHTSIQASFSYQRISLPDDRKDETISKTGVDLIPKVGLQYHLDHRDVVGYPRKGYLVQWNVTRTGFKTGQPEFWRFDFDHRLYVKLSNRISIGGKNLLRLNNILHGDSLPTYDKIYIGFGDRIRGYFNNRFTANNLMLQFVEARIDIIPVKYFTWRNAPFLGAFFQQLKYGLSLGLFADTGVVWNNYSEIRPEKFNSGFGAGLHFHVPYAHILRLDYAINDKGRGQFIFEVGVVF